MKSKMLISVGSCLTDLTEATDGELRAWINLMDDVEKDETIVTLVNRIKEIQIE